MWSKLKKEKKVKEMKTKKIIMLCISLLILTSFSLQAVPNDNSTILEPIPSLIELTSHPAINITGNIEMDDFPNKTGSGTASDPYIIQFLNISQNLLFYSIKMVNVTRYVVIRNIAIGNVVLSSSAIKLENCANINVTDSYITINFAGIIGVNLTNCFFSNNIMEFNNGLGFSFVNSSSISLINNTIRSFTYREGILIRNSTNIIIKKNNISQMNYPGIRISLSNNTEIIENYISNVSYYGIEFYHSNNSQIKKNVIQDMRGGNEGISLIKSNYNVISENIISQTHLGISLTLSDNNTISYSQISNNDYGIFLSYSDGNNVFENSLCDNYDDDIFEENYDGDYNSIHDNYLDCSSPVNTISGYNIPILLIFGLLGLITATFFIHSKKKQ